MSAICPGDLMRFFEEENGIQFIDVATGKPALELMTERGHGKPESDYDLWLEGQDEATKLEQKMGEL